MSTSVLVVDADLQVTKQVSGILASRGYEVRTASEADSAMASLGIKPPALVLTGLGMPGVSGLEFCRRVREASKVPIIVMSGSAECASEVEALDSGADDYLAKPLVTDRLLARVRVALRRSLEAPPEPALSAASERHSAPAARQSGSARSGARSAPRRSPGSSPPPY